MFLDTELTNLSKRAKFEEKTSPLEVRKKIRKI